MTTKELIKLLQEQDPDGNGEIILGKIYKSCTIFIKKEKGLGYIAWNESDGKLKNAIYNEM